MEMPPKRSPKAIFIALAALPLLAALAWLSGFVYWQLRISRAIADLKRSGPGKYETELFYANPELLRIGSRGLPRFLDELDQALLRGDEDQAFTFCCGLTDLLNGAEEVDGNAASASGSYLRTRERQTLEEMRAGFRQSKEDWPDVRTWYAPWWKWWVGHRRRL
jgi:hypothetical protein